MTENQNEIKKIFNINKKSNVEEKPKISDTHKNNISEDKEEKSKTTKEFLPKLIIKKETYNNNTSMLNQKRERAPSNNKEEDNNNIEDKSINSTTNNSSKKRTTFNEAKKEMKDFEILILNTEKELQRKYGFTFPDLSFEDNLPEDIQSKLLDDFLNLPRITKLLDEASEQNNSNLIK